MGLFKLGEIKGLTLAMIQNAAQRCYSEHVSMSQSPTSAPMLQPAQMQVTEISVPKGDMPFDRISYAKWHKEPFHINSCAEEIWKVESYGAGWTIRSNEGNSLRFDSEEKLASIIEADCGSHPNPYIAMLEFVYDEKGHVAGYGVRQDGSSEIFYD